MHRNEHAVEIERPAGAIFPHLAGAEKRLRWMGALVESEQLGEGAPGLGTRFRDVFEDHGQRVELDAEIVEWEPSARLAIRLRSRLFEATVRQRLEERDGRTRLTTVIETDYQSLAARLVAGAITRHAQGRLESDLERLKAIVEQEGPE